MEVALVALLSPFLPHLLKAGEGLAEDAARALATEAGQHAKAIWGRLRPKLEQQPGQLEPAAAAAANPKAFQDQLRSLFDADPAFAGEISGLLHAAERAGVVATRGGAAVGGNVAAEQGSIGVIGTVGGDVRLGGPSGDR